MNKTLDVIYNLRSRNRIFRLHIDNKQVNGTIDSILCYNIIEIACALAEMSIFYNRKIKTEEIFYFERGYNFNFEFKGSEFSDVLDLYLDLCESLTESGVI